MRCRQSITSQRCRTIRRQGTEWSVSNRMIAEVLLRPLLLGMGKVKVDSMKHSAHNNSMIFQLLEASGVGLSKASYSTAHLV